MTFYLDQIVLFKTVILSAWILMVRLYAALVTGKILAACQIILPQEELVEKLSVFCGLDFGALPKDAVNFLDIPGLIPDGCSATASLGNGFYNLTVPQSLSTENCWGLRCRVTARRRVEHCCAESHPRPTQMI